MSPGRPEKTDDDGRRSRRRFLQTLGAVGTAGALAGCPAAGDSDDGSGTGGPTDAGTGTGGGTNGTETGTGGEGGTGNAYTGQLQVEETAADDRFPFVTGESAAPIVVDDEDAAVVEIAASAVAEDVGSVAGSAPAVETDLPDDADRVVLAGSVSGSEHVGRLVEDEAFDAAHVADGQWESFVVTVVEDPYEGVDEAFVVAGSDARGAAYGLFELSEAAGVSPWVWWADAPTADMDALHVTAGHYEFGPPSVQYRGVFLNDTDWGLLPWASETFEPEYGNIGPKTYAQIFELLLRLDANYVWPAMHGDYYKDMEVFYGNFEKQEVADRYSIVVGTAHNEPMLVNPHAWDEDEYGEYNYVSNPEGVRRAWRDRAEATAGSENVYQLGMRGAGDTAMAGVDSVEEGAEVLGDIIAEQRDILREFNDEDVSDIPQVFTPYKEVLSYYEEGIDIPDDVAINWPDDNFGHVRNYPDEAEQDRSGGSGSYYHVSYLGSPHPYLLLHSTSPALTWREMQRGMELGMRDQWVVNCGDLKRREWGTEFALDVAWDSSRWQREDIRSYFEQVAARDVDPEYAEPIADVMMEYYELATQHKPEAMGFNYSGWAGRGDIQDPAFSLTNYGDEVQRRIERYRDLRTTVEEMRSSMDEDASDAFFELVYFPVASAANINEKLLHAYKSRAYAAQDRTEANHHANEAEAAYDRRKADHEEYNTVIAGGKWERYHPVQPGPEGSPTSLGPPPVERVFPIGDVSVDVTVEGSIRSIGGMRDARGKSGQLPRIASGAVEFDFAPADASVTGETIVRSSDDDGPYIGVPEGEGNQTEFPTDDYATFEFTVPEHAGSQFTLYADVTHPSVESDSWFVQIDDSDPFLWNNQTGSGEFDVLERTIGTGDHTLTFYAREDGPKLRGVRLVARNGVNELPAFNRYSRERRFVDIYRSGEGTPEWTAEPSVPWLTLSETSGTLEGDGTRIWVDVDYESAPAEADLEAHVDVTSGDQSFRVYASVFNEALDDEGATHVERDGVVALDAEHYATAAAGDVAEWSPLTGLGRRGTGMVPEPLTGWAVDDLDAVDGQCPALEYVVRVLEGGEATLVVEATPSFPLGDGETMRTAVAVDDGDPQWVTFQMGEADLPMWSEHVTQNVLEGTIDVTLDPGVHTLRVFATDPAVNVEHLTVDFGGVRESYLGPTETPLRR
mgnify:CR=1 FL=1